MKIFLQLILLLVLIIIVIFFYNIYFKEDEAGIDITSNKGPVKEQIIPENENNRIKNLKYNVELIQSGKYEIEAASSELVYEGNNEIILMKDVSAIFTDTNGRKLYISSSNARFNTINYNTFFYKNIKIQYLNNIITSNKLNFDFVDNNILVHENVFYKGSNRQIYTDNIRIDLLTKDIKIYMNSDKHKVEVLSN